MNNVIGHEAIRRRFLRTIDRGRLASTYLLVGPRGVGKRRFAEHLATTLLCSRREPQELSPCGDCESCRLADAGNHPDLLLVEKPAGKSSLPIDLFIGSGDQRNRSGLCHDLALRPLKADRRFAVIDDADDLSVESANSLLKTLEEPPPRSLILLIGTSLSRQLPTIRSRSQVVRFRPLQEEQVQRVITTLSEEVSTDEASRLAARSGGSVSRALELRDEALSDAREAIVGCLSSEDLDPLRLFRFMEDRSKASGTEPSVRRKLIREMLAAMIDHYRRVLRQAAEQRYPVETASRLLEECLTAEESLLRNANQSALMQQLATRLWRLQRAV